MIPTEKKSIRTRSPKKKSEAATPRMASCWNRIALCSALCEHSEKLLRVWGDRLCHSLTAEPLWLFWLASHHRRPPSPPLHVVEAISKTDNLWPVGHPSYQRRKPSPTGSCLGTPQRGILVTGPDVQWQICFSIWIGDGEAPQQCYAGLEPTTQPLAPMMPKYRIE